MTFLVFTVLVFLIQAVCLGCMLAMYWNTPVRYRPSPWWPRVATIMCGLGFVCLVVTL